jgi:hypothetical protein
MPMPLSRRRLGTDGGRLVHDEAVRVLDEDVDAGVRAERRVVRVPALVVEAQAPIERQRTRGGADGWVQRLDADPARVADELGLDGAAAEVDAAGEVLQARAELRDLVKAHARVVGDAAACLSLRFLPVAFGTITHGFDAIAFSRTLRTPCRCVTLLRCSDSRSQ